MSDGLKGVCFFSSFSAKHNGDRGFEMIIEILAVHRFDENV